VNDLTPLQFIGYTFGYALAFIVVVAAVLFGPLLYRRYRTRRLLETGDFRILQRSAIRTQRWLNRNSLALFDAPKYAKGDPVRIAINLIRATEIIRARKIEMKDDSWMRKVCLHTAMQKALKTCSVADAIRLFTELENAGRQDMWDRAEMRMFESKVWGEKGDRTMTQEEWNSTKALVPHMKTLSHDIAYFFKLHMANRNLTAWVAEFDDIPPSKQTEPVTA